jgi:hypothetical protein
VPNQHVIPYSPETAPFHQRHYTPEAFRSLLHDCDWRILEWRGQASPESPVGPLDSTSRTLVVEAVRREE